MNEGKPCGRIQLLHSKTKAKECYMRPHEVVCESKSGLRDLPMMCAQSL